jgi:hypothetical protein
VLRYNELVATEIAVQMHSLYGRLASENVNAQHICARKKKGRIADGAISHGVFVLFS